MVRKFIITLWHYDRAIQTWTIYGEEHAWEYFRRFQTFDDEHLTIESC